MFSVQERIIESILTDVEQQEVAAIVAKPVADEQNVISQILQDHLNSPEFDRKELRELRRFLKQLLLGASVQILRKAIQDYTSTSNVHPLFEILGELYQQQGTHTIESPITIRKKRLVREELHLVCYEYIYS